MAQLGVFLAGWAGATAFHLIGLVLGWLGF